MRFQFEYENSKYSFELADLGKHFKWFDEFEKEANTILDEGLVLPAYDYVLKCSHVFNVLDSRVNYLRLREWTHIIKKLSKKMCWSLCSK